MQGLFYTMFLSENANNRHWGNNRNEPKTNNTCLHRFYSSKTQTYPNFLKNYDSDFCFQACFF